MLKKIAMVIFFVLLFFNKNKVVNMDNYQIATKEIEIKGEVVSPGVYEVDYDAAIDDLLKICGGITQNADLSSINQTQVLPNKSVLVIPKTKETKLISINQGTVEELMTLPGIGQATAERIIEYRQNQPFYKIEDIMMIKGIKEKLFNKIKDYICL